MSVFKNIKKIILIEVNQETHKFYALKVGDLVNFSKLNKAIEIDTNQGNLENLALVIVDHYAGEVKPSISELLELDVATIRHISQELVMASTPLDYEDR